MKRILDKCFGAKDAPSIDGVPSAKSGNLALFQGVLLGLFLLAGFFFLLSFLDRESFHRRFLSDFYENQRPVIALSKDDFAPQYSELMTAIAILQTGGDAPNIFAQYDQMIASSLQITQAAERAKSAFSFDDFSAEEQRKIDNFYAVLEQMDSGRHQYLLSLQDCLRLSVDGADAAVELCDQLKTDWEKQASQLLDDLVAALELSEADKSTLEGLF